MHQRLPSDPSPEMPGLRAELRSTPSDSSSASGVLQRFLKTTRAKQQTTVINKLGGIRRSFFSTFWGVNQERSPRLNLFMRSTVKRGRLTKSLHDERSPRLKRKRNLLAGELFLR